jgi:hypothetical protein
VDRRRGPVGDLARVPPPATSPSRVKRFDFILKRKLTGGTLCQIFKHYPNRFSVLIFGGKKAVLDSNFENSY